jgi:tRNA threonylcarbamoyladenosine biosynthesis protein TsaE
LPSESYQAVDADEMRALGRQLSQTFEPGDLVILSGELGAGKTTLTQGIAEGLHVQGPITSPTFVIARVHESMVNGPDLVHVDAYRLHSLEEVEELDLETTMSEAVTVVEWGAERAEYLSDKPIVIAIDRDTQPRSVTVVRT